VKFLVDRCAGRRLAEWLRGQGHDVLESRERGADPGDDVILEWAVAESRILITMDKDFGDLVFEGQKPHSGLVRLPDVPAERRIELMATLLHEHTTSLASAAVITVRGGRVRVSRQGSKA
jgi:predicted nuclease of predicted toxin-antitoxin system